MNDVYNRKYFEFMKYFFHDPISLGSIRLFQVGEVMLEDGGQINIHPQECHEISIVISGSGSFYVNNERYRMKQGDIHIVSKGHIHNIHSECREGFRFAYLGFDFLTASGQGELTELSDFYATSVGTTRDNGDVFTLFRILINEWYYEPKLSRTTIESLTSTILVLVNRFFENTEKGRYNPVKDTSSIGRKIYDIVQYIDNNILTIKSVGMVAHRFGYTENYVSHMFKNKTGCNIQQYITGAKIRMASKLLLDSQCSISEVAERLNYSSPQAFAKMFRKNMDCTPSQFRANKSSKS